MFRQLLLVQKFVVILWWLYWNLLVISNTTQLTPWYIPYFTIFLPKSLLKHRNKLCFHWFYPYTSRQTFNYSVISVIPYWFQTHLIKNGGWEWFGSEAPWGFYFPWTQGRILLYLDIIILFQGEKFMIYYIMINCSYKFKLVLVNYLPESEYWFNIIL